MQMWFTFVGAGTCCLDIGFRHMFSALCSIAFCRCIRHAVRLPPCVYADASPGVASFVGREFSQFCAGHGLLVISIKFVLLLKLYNLMISFVDSFVDCDICWCFIDVYSFFMMLIVSMYIFTLIAHLRDDTNVNY